MIKIEPPGGDAARRRGPFPSGANADPEASAAFLYANTSKRSIVLDPASADDRALRDRLIAGAHAVIASEPSRDWPIGGSATSSSRH